MGATVERLLIDAMTLSEEDRFELVEALTASFDRDMIPPISDGLHKLIRSRCEAIDSGTEPLIPWEEVKRQLGEQPGG